MSIYCYLSALVFRNIFRSPDSRILCGKFLYSAHAYYVN